MPAEACIGTHHVKRVDTRAFMLVLALSLRGGDLTSQPDISTATVDCGK